MVPTSAAPQARRIPTPLALRARLWDRRPTAVRRHAARVTSRIAVLFAGDVAALVATRALLRAVLAVAAPGWFATFDTAGPLASPGRPGSLIFALSAVLALAITGCYGSQRNLNLGARLALAMVLAGVATTAVVAAATGIVRAMLEAAVVGTIAWVALLVLRAVSERFIRYVWPRNLRAGVAVLAETPDASEADVGPLLASYGGEYLVGGRYSLEGAVRRDPGALRTDVRALLAQSEAEALILCGQVRETELRALLDAAIDADCQLVYPARALALEGVHPKVVWHHDRPFLELGPPALRPHAVVTKRVTDVVASILLLAVSLPVMAAIAIAIRLDSHGPVLFAQDRAGLGGRRFRMLKFRTMHLGADDQKKDLVHLNQTGDVRLFKIPADPRVTRIGRFLRRWSLDELPQLFNVLRGEMSLVGPRPFFESDFVAYEDHHFRRLDTKPGITGLWQVSGRSDVVDFEDVVYLDRQYIEQWSFWLDLGILFRTIPAVVRRTGAY